MPRIVKAALTQTINRYPDMPSSMDGLDALSDRMETIRATNVNHHIKLAEHAAKQGVKLICFGEVFTGPYFALNKHPMWLQLAEPMTGPTVATLREVASRLSLVIVAPIYELTDNGERFNTAVFIDATGEVLGHYSKTHIPHGSNEDGQFVERFYFSRSTGRRNKHPANISRNRYYPVFETAVGRVGCAICYDRHFPLVLSTLAKEGAEIVVSPAVTFGEKSERMWEMEFCVDAARYNLFIGGSNRLGQEAPWGQPYFGKSYFTGPNQRCENISDNHELIIADLDLNQLTSHDPSGWKLQRDCRFDTFTS